MTSDYYAMRLDEPSNSMLRFFRESPFAYWHHVNGMKREAAPFRYGRAFHLALLEPEKFRQTFVAIPQGKLTSNGAKLEWLDECSRVSGVDFSRVALGAADEMRQEVASVLESSGRTVVSTTELETLRAQVESLKLPIHTMARKLLMAGEHERELHWEHGTLRPKGRVDGLVDPSGIMYDLKGCQDASADAFRRSLWSYGYHYQEAMYRIGGRALGLDVRDFVFVLAEQKPPYHWNVVRCNELDVAVAADRITSDLRRLEECIATDTWPGLIGTEPETVSLRRGINDQE